jgi:hypothetical protein
VVIASFAQERQGDYFLHNAIRWIEEVAYALAWLKDKTVRKNAGTHAKPVKPQETDSGSFKAGVKIP